MKHISNRDGFAKPLLTLITLAFMVYAGLQFGIPYYRYSAFKSETEAVTRVGIGNIRKIKDDVYEAAKHYKIPVDEDDIVVTKNKDNVNVQVSWSVDVDIFGLYQRRLDFKVDVEQ